MNQQNTNSSKYKSMLCKHYETSKGCAFKEKCQFAHGIHELRPVNGMPSMINPLSTNDNSIADPMKKGSNPQNYKIVKCKYWEKDGSCRYGTLCTFAHGEAEIRTKADNLIMNAPMNNPFMNQMMMNPPYVDPNFPMQNMMNPLALGFDPNMMMAMQGMMGFPQGMDPSMMNMNQMNNPDFMMNYPGANVYQGYPGNINENGN